MRTKTIFILLLIIPLFLLTGCQKEISKTVGQASDFENLQTYQSQASGWGIDYSVFEIKYPEEMFVEDCPGKAGLSFNQNDISHCGEGPRDSLPPINIMVRPTFEDNPEVAKQKIQDSLAWSKKSWKDFSQEEISVGPYRAIKTTGVWQIPEGGMRPELNGTKEEIIYIPASSAVFEISLGHYGLSEKEIEKYQAVLEQILKSFKLID